MSNISTMTVFLTSLFQMLRHFWDYNTGRRAGGRAKVTNPVFPLPSLSLRIIYFVEVVSKMSKISIFLTLFFMASMVKLRLFYYSRAILCSGIKGSLYTLLIMIVKVIVPPCLPTKQMI